MIARCSNSRSSACSRSGRGTATTSASRCARTSACSRTYLSVRCTRRSPASRRFGLILAALAALVARRATAKAAIALGGRSTRARKVYEITPHGEEVFEQLLQSADEQDRDPRGFSLRLAFARHLTPQARVRLLEKRRGQLIDRLQRGEWSMRRRTRPMDEYEHSIAEHAQETMANDLSWVERLLDRERAALDRERAALDRSVRDTTEPAPAALQPPVVATKDLSGTPLPARVGAGSAPDERQRQ